MFVQILFRFVRNCFDIGKCTVSRKCETSTNNNCSLQLLCTWWVYRYRTNDTASRINFLVQWVRRSTAFVAPVSTQTAVVCQAPHARGSYTTVWNIASDIVGVGNTTDTPRCRVLYYTIDVWRPVRREPVATPLSYWVPQLSSESLLIRNSAWETFIHTFILLCVFTEQFNQKYLTLRLKCVQGVF